MTTPHTPGPWKRERDGSRSGGRIVSTVTNDEIYHLCDDATYEANKNLEAAGPDLLALALHIESMAGDVYLEGHPEWQEIVIEARIAIAFATGKEPA